MFIQNATQAFRSVFVALFILSVIPRWCTAQESKVDASVLTALQTQSTVSVAIYLEDEPPSKQISDAVAAEFEPNIKAKAAEIRARIRPFRRQNQALPPNVKAAVRTMHESLDTQTGRMRREIGRRLKNRVAASQQRVRTVIENAGGTVYAQLALGNIIGAQLSDTAVNQIAASDDVRWIELDPAVVPTLAGSAKIIYASRFWDAGYDGGCYDVGIVDRGVEDENRYLRSKAAGQLIERKPDDPEPTGHHGTAVAGIVAMTPYKIAAKEYKGIAYGLDKILDATTMTTWGDAVAAAEWAMTYDSDDMDDDSASADVVNLSLSAVLGNVDYIMDMDDPDYTFGRRLDELIDTHKVLIIKSAGNQYGVVPPKDEYSLSWGADSYNAIVVGSSTGVGGENADGETESRAENEVYSTSGRGPTPGDRKKPDVVAPGTGITTTFRGGGFATFSGTSAATPHVSGAVLLLADHGLWHPMMQKALLINSAEDRGDPGWDKAWGWGYIDLYAALEQYDYTQSDSIDGGTEKWYKGTMNECQTATLVWHIHKGEPLSNLDMRLYDATTQVLIDFSTSPKDNVEQVKLPSGRDRAVYLRIVHRGSEGETETFGLAVPSEFESLAQQPFTP